MSVESITARVTQINARVGVVSLSDSARSFSHIKFDNYSTL